MGLNYLVVGSSGYIGKKLLDRVKLYGDADGTSSSLSATIRLDLRNQQKFDYTKIISGCSIFLTAANSSPDQCAHEYDSVRELNVLGTSVFIRKAISTGARIIFFSSDTVYGEKIEEFDEAEACSPAGEYAHMKHEVEEMFLSDPMFKSIRLSYVFSKDDKFTKYLLDCSRKNQEVEIFHPFYRAVIHRDDVVDAAIALAQRWNEFPQSVINFGGPEVLARTEYAEILQKEALTNLKFSVTEPNADFFKNRPKEIKMRSPLLESLLGRPPHSLLEAARIEFDIGKKYD